MRLLPTELHFRPGEGSSTVGWHGEPKLTDGGCTENHEVSQRASQVAVRVANLSHSYHAEGFYTGARSRGLGDTNSRCHRMVLGEPRLVATGIGVRATLPPVPSPSPERQPDPYYSVCT